MGIERIAVRTDDGSCPVYIVFPDGSEGPWPAVILYMDGLGIRPGLIEVAERLAGAGYLVLVPDLFYRFGPYGPLDPRVVFAGDFRAVVGPMIATTDNHKAAADTRALFAHLDDRSDVRPGKIAVVGFCMGGGMALTAAGTFPDRVAAAASFHGGNLANDTPLSPHLLAPAIKAEVYVGAADKDPSYPPEMDARLDAAFTEAGVRHCSEFYDGAKHGWMMPDFPIHDAAAAERGWTALLALLDRAFGTDATFAAD